MALGGISRGNVRSFVLGTIFGGLLVFEITVSFVGPSSSTQPVVQICGSTTTSATSTDQSTPIEHIMDQPEHHEAVVDNKSMSKTQQPMFVGEAVGNEIDERRSKTNEDTEESFMKSSSASPSASPSASAETTSHERANEVNQEEKIEEDGERDDITSVTETKKKKTKKRKIKKKNSFVPDPMFQAKYDEIDHEDMAKKCARYEFRYEKPENGSVKTPKRRLFLGSLVADDSVEVMMAHATEVYGLYDVIVLNESNTTHLATPRKMRFNRKGKVGYDFVHSGAFGPNTEIRIDLWVEPSKLYGMARERQHRNTITTGWAAAGMKPEDVGIMSDMDEVLPRDFLVALKHCELPDYLVDETCQFFRFYSETMVYEMSPECVSLSSWFHPDVTTGRCIEGIGDETGRVKREREWELLPKCGYGGSCRNEEDKDDGWYEDKIVKSNRFPLSIGVDLREILYVPQERVVMKDDQHSVTGYHFHNFFSDLTLLRQKYETYAHFDPNVKKKTLREMQDDIDCAVRCVHNLPNLIYDRDDEEFVKVKRFLGGFSAVSGSQPIFFLNETYRRDRHERVRQMIFDDEKVYGHSHNLTEVEALVLRRKKREKARKERASKAMEGEEKDNK